MNVSNLNSKLIGIATALLLAAGAAQAQVAQSPLSAGGNVPGNLLLVPSVEYPTILSIANIEAEYSPASTYTGYFDSFKCYRYIQDTTDDNQSYFNPVSTNTTKTCNGAGLEWSGNFLNWAGTQTIDPFRKALTGGLRTTDTSGTTILEKARYHNANESLFPLRRVPTSGNSAVVVQGAMGTGVWERARVRIARLGNRMFFGASGTAAGVMNVMNPEPAAIPYDNRVLNAANEDLVFSVRVRVKVCDPAFLENNCVRYSGGYKPEGLLQKYANRMRYSAFSYLNDSSATRDGGVLRARQKFIGPQLLNPMTGAWETNTAAEWDSGTGIIFANPDATDASNTNGVVAGGTGTAAPTLAASGVINYMNKFGQMTTRAHKSFDPVSELYYTSIRYLRGMTDVAAYSSLAAVVTSQDRYELADGFPIITNWDDPIQYYCQNNSILGIGDVYTHKDKNLRGYTGTASNEPGAMPAEVTADTVDVQEWSDRVAALEALSPAPTFPTTMPVNGFSGRENSAFMAGLAYYAHTQDLRTSGANSTDFQTVSTYWVDVRETQNLEPRRANMYWLATKYGGFEPPDVDNNGKFTNADYDPTTRTTALPNAWWASTDPADQVMTNGKQGFTDETLTFASNYYTANQADKMVQSLTRVFAKIANKGAGSGSALAANSTRLDTETLVFQAQFLNGIWMGQLNAFDVNPMTGAVDTIPQWRASTAMPIPAARNIFMHSPGATPAHRAFSGANITATQLPYWTFSGIGSATSQDLVDYFRGVQTLEESSAGNGTLRTRVPPANFSAALGDIVNSTPIFVGKPNQDLYSGAAFSGGSAYAAWATASARVNRTPVVWVGSNDGMLHAFNATTSSPPAAPDPNSGREIYAFVPNAAIVNGLAQYANPDYVHKYFVDGDMAIADAYDGTNWRTILVGTMGRGGPGIFALDITVPETPTFLWEKSTDIAALGKNIGRPVIAQVANGDWRVILGNGFDRGASPQLVMINLFSGTVTTVDTGGSTSNNGLSAVLARDTNADGFADTAYAGDMRGNLWKFSSIGTTPSVVRVFQALDSASASQAISAAPLVGRDSSTGTVWIFFGTGRYLTTTDVDTTQTQTWYGIKDNGVTTATRATLVQRTITAMANIGEFSTRSVSEGTTAEIAGVQGWYMDLPVSGERIVVPNRFLGEALIATTRIPDAVNACRPTGRGFVMAISPFTGGRLPQTFFDANRDGVIDAADMIGGNNPSGLGLDSGLNETISIGAVLEINTDEGVTKNILTQGTSANAARMSWREVVN